MKEISVVIPTYNRELQIGAALCSVLEQKGRGESFVLKEVLIIDDGSTDDTEKRITEFDDPCIRFHKLERNGGAGHARNTGVKMAGAEWIAFQDSDDIWEADKLEKQTEYLGMHPETDMVTHPIRATFSDGREIITEAPVNADPIEVLAKRNFVDTPTMLLRRDAFLELNGFDESLKALEDWEFALRFAAVYKIGIVREALLWADMTIEGISSNMANYYDARCRMIIKNRPLLEERGCFQSAMEKLFLHARENGVLEQVGKMMELYLSGR
ncbi:MAG: glycosyltransferase family 2 protein [Lachnospiraceae bacterium]|nr:glycosyltransferase family 2 protein [Lachnospiraceae bacterium]